MPEPNASRPTRGGGFPGWIYVLHDLEQYRAFKAGGGFRGLWNRGKRENNPDAFSYRRIMYILRHRTKKNEFRGWPHLSRLYDQCSPDPDELAWSRDYEGYTGPSDRLSPICDVLGVDALQHFDAKSLGRLSACAIAFGHKNEYRWLPERRRSLCEAAAYRRLRADERFRDARSGEMPESDSSVWARDGFPGWLHVLRDWEQALNFERRGGFNAFDLSDKLEHIEEMNRGAQSFRKMKRVLGHMRSTRRIRDM